MADTTDVNIEASESAPTVGAGWRDALFGLGAALCWSISPIFVRHGLKRVASPLLGVTVGMITCVAAYGVALLFRRRHAFRPSPGAAFWQSPERARSVPIPRDALLFQLLAGVLVGLSTWARWIALDLAPVGVVVALGRLSVPVVLVLAPLIVGQHLERVTLRLWLGAALIISGSLLLIMYR